MCLFRFWVRRNFTETSFPLWDASRQDLYHRSRGVRHLVIGFSIYHLIATPGFGNPRRESEHSHAVECRNSLRWPARPGAFIVGVETAPLVWLLYRNHGVPSLCCRLCCRKSLQPNDARTCDVIMQPKTNLPIRLKLLYREKIDKSCRVEVRPVKECVEEKVAVGEVENGRDFGRSAGLLFRRVKWARWWGWPKKTWNDEVQDRWQGKKGREVKKYKSSREKRVRLK